MRVIDYGRLLLLAALWGASFLFMRITTPAFGALNSAFLRVLFAAIALGLLLGVQGKWSGYQGKFTSTLQLGVINSGLPFLMYCLAAQWLPAGYSATLNATAPMMGVLIGALCFAEPLTLRKGGGAILGAIGVAVIARPTSGLSAALLLPGIGACLTCNRKPYIHNNNDCKTSITVVEKRCFSLCCCTALYLSPMAHYAIPSVPFSFSPLHVYASVSMPPSGQASVCHFRCWGKGNFGTIRCCKVKPLAVVRKNLHPHKLR